jgi:ribose 1,5-bisphosphokinase
MTRDVASSPHNDEGRLVLVVGPSGAGKDTLIDLVREACAGDAAVVFPTRAVTRDASVHEANVSLSPVAFEQARECGEFALHWHAHGLWYGVPKSIVDDISQGRVVVVNVSRTVIDAARRLFPRVTVVVVTAPADILTARLAARNRAGDGRLDARLQRSDAVGRFDADVTINNVGAAETHARELLAVVRGYGVVAASG